MAGMSIVNIVFRLRTILAPYLQFQCRMVYAHIVKDMLDLVFHAFFIVITAHHYMGSKAF